MSFAPETDHFPPVWSLAQRTEARRLFPAPSPAASKLALSEVERLQARTALALRASKPTEEPKRTFWTDPFFVRPSPEAPLALAETLAA